MMKDKIRSHVEELFAEAPSGKKTVELKEEIIQNLQEKYDDMIAEGKSEEAAYNITLAGLGDIDELINELKKDHVQKTEVIKKDTRKNSFLFSLAIGLYVLCIVPPIALDRYDNDIGAILMFVIAAIATFILIYSIKTKPKYLKEDETIVEEFKEWKAHKEKEDNSILKMLSSFLWIITIIVYIAVSFTTGQWHITWIIFIIASLCEGLLKAIIDFLKSL